MIQRRPKLFGIRTEFWYLAGTILLLGAFLMPLFYGITTSLKSDNQISTPNSPILPSTQLVVEIEGKSYDVIELPMDDGTVRQMVLYKKGRQESQLLDTENLEKPPILWEGNWRSLEPVWKSHAQWRNYIEAWKTIDFMKLVFNTVKYATISTIGAVFAAALVGYGFARFEFPGKNILFMILIATIILPPSVTLIPTYAFFFKIGWVGTWLPLIVPTLFGNGYNVFLLRQFFMTIPIQMEEAARIDGAGPIRIFFSIILPQSVPGLTAVGLFHFFYCWNDFFGPLVYLSGNPDKYPITVGLTSFNGLYSQQVNMIQAAAIISAVIPFLIFLFAQKAFLRGVVITGVDK